MELVAYLRVSTAGQAQDGYGLEVQEAAVRSWARANGHKVVRVCSDAGLCGALDATARPGLSEALDMLRPPPRATGLIVAKLDRLARALGVQETVLAVAWRAGAKVFSADTGEILQDDPSDPMRTLLRQVVGAVAEFERALIAKRLRDGRAAKAAAGKHAVGEYAFGTRGAGEGRDRDAAPDEAEQMTVARIVELRNSGASLRAIVARLDSEGLKPRRAAHWSPQSVQAVCLREGLAPGAAPVVSADQAEEARRHGRLGPLPD